MTPKEKAQELVDKFLNAEFNCKDCDMMYCDVPCTRLSIWEAKQCALICVEEILAKHYDDWDEISEYWTEVKKQIEKL